MRARARRQQGVTLLVGMLLLIAVLLLGASSARMVLQGEKAARAERDRHIALQAAEEGLMDAEHDIDAGSGSAARASVFSGAGVDGFSDGCGEGVGLGLCGPAPGTAAPAWQRADLANEDGGAEQSVAFGAFTGASMPSGEGLLPFRAPRYLIERLPDHRPGEEAGLTPHYIYRVTAIGFGVRPGTEVIVQSVYRKPE